jgi:predicted permease
MFTLIVSSRLTGADVFRISALSTILAISLGLLTWIVGKFLKFERQLLAAVILCVLFMNAGNYGLSLNLFAFGDEALAQASIFFAFQGILIYSLGIIIASLGRFPLKEAMLGLLKIPMLYALMLAFLFVRFQWTLPLPLDRTVNLLSQAAIPAMLILLGIQMVRVEWSGKLLAMGVANTFRLVVSPLLGILLASILGLQGAARQAGILETAMPTAVFVTILATEYDIEPAFVTAVVFTTTLLSPITLTPLLAFLGA